MKYESGSRVSCLVSLPPNPPSLAPNLALAGVALVSISADRDPYEFGSGQASSDWPATVADTFALLSISNWVGYTHCKARCLQR